MGGLDSTPFGETTSKLSSSNSGHAHDHPRPEAEKPITAQVAITQALRADVKPGAIGRSDDAPYIWSEISTLSQQFGRLEKQVEIVSTDVQRHQQTLHTVSVSTQTLCNRHDQLTEGMGTLGATLTNSLRDILAGPEGRLTVQIDALSTSVSGLTGDVKANSGELAQLKMDQAAVVTAVKLLSPFLKNIALALGSLVLALFAAATLFWTQSMRPSLVNDISSEAQKLIEKDQAHKAAQTENTRLKAEIEALKAKKP